MAKKRGQNEGSISQRKDGRWAARITTGYKDGKQVRKCIYGKTREAVAAEMTRALALHQRGVHLPNEKLTTGAFLATWLDTTAKARLRPRTHQRYSELVNLHLKPDLGRYPLARLTPQTVQQHLGALTTTGLSARTVVQVRAVLRVALNQALRHGYVTRNVATLVDPPRVEKHTPVFLSREQAAELLSAVEGDALEALITVALSTGLRMGEILGLSWPDLDLPGKQLTVRRQQQVIGGKAVLVETKTSRSDRVLDLPQITVDALERHRLRQILEDRAVAGPEWQESGRVFTDGRGAPLHNWNVLKRFQKLLANAGLPKMRLHDLRHSCATLLLASGVHPRIVMEILGHSTIAMTMNVYSHALPSVLRDAADSMNTALSVRGQ